MGRGPGLRDEPSRGIAVNVDLVKKLEAHQRSTGSEGIPLFTVTSVVTHFEAEPRSEQLTVIAHFKLKWTSAMMFIPGYPGANKRIPENPKRYFFAASAFFRDATSLLAFSRASVF